MNIKEYKEALEEEISKPKACYHDLGVQCFDNGFRCGLRAAKIMTKDLKAEEQKQ